MRRLDRALVLSSLLLAGCASAGDPGVRETRAPGAPRQASAPRTPRASGTGAGGAAPRPVERESTLVDIPFTRYVLPNGLTLIVHEDRKAPIAAVNVWYHVGSKNEKPGKTGFAHLFEHLMFQGSENFEGEFFDPLQKAGATGMNGTTNEDRTNYFETVPKNALDLALMLESDRMGHLLGAIDQAKLDEQRGVVQNEKRQGENRPYGRSDELIVAGTAPAGHPYSWDVIGSMEDLDAASLEDVHEWFRAYYGAANAVLVVAGDVDAEEVRAKVARYFGDVPAGPPIARPKAWVAPLTETKRAVMEDRVGQPRITRVWNVAPWGDPSLEHLSLLASVLAGGKTSRLDQRLVRGAELATDVRARLGRRELGSQFSLVVTAKPDADLTGIEAIVDEVLAELCAEGPTEDELERARAQQLAGFVRGVERVGGGFGAKTDTLAEGEVYAGDPGWYRKRIARIEDATAADLRDAARTWLGDAGSFVLTVVPFPKYRELAAGADRSKLPDTGATADATFPAFQRARLANGLEVVLVERHAVPTVELALLLPGGSAADPRGLSGCAAMTMDLLDEGTTTKSAIEIGEIQERLGARLQSAAGDDGSTLSLSALAADLGASLDLLADVLLNPAFPAEDFERIRRETLVRMQSGKLEANAMAARVLPPLLFGETHPYGALGGGRGTEESLAALRREDLARFHATWAKPDHARLVVVGDTTLAELVPLLEQRLSAWKPGAVPAKELGAARAIERPVVYLLDRPQAEQSLIQVAIAAPPTSDPRDLAIDVMNTFFGGSFMSRVNLNLREEKGWSYGARSRIGDAAGPRAFVISAPVQTDKTQESMQEIAKEVAGILGERPATAAELAQAQAERTLTLAGRWETNAAVLGSLVQLLRYDLPEDHWTTYAERVRALTVADVDAAARAVIAPERAVWIVVGDRAKVEAGVRAAGIGDVVVIDADGEPVEEP